MTTDQLYDKVLQHLSESKPLYVVRCGDGESILMNGFEDTDKLHWLFRRQLGYVPTVEHINQIRANVIEAYKHADIIGMPENKRGGLNQYWCRCYEILEKEIGLLPETTSIDFHNDWLDRGLITELLTGRQKVFYVSCHNLDQQFIDAFQIRSVIGYQISPEHTFFPGTSENHYPDQFTQVKNWIGSTDMTGCLFMYGAGIVGKIYGKWASDQGAVAIDLGNVFDLMAGFKTRGQGRGAGVRYEKYKL